MHKTSTEKMKITSSSEISKTIYHNGSHLLLIGKSRWSDFKVSYKWFFLFWNKPCNLKTSKLNKRRGCLLEEIVTGFEYILTYISFDCNQVFEFLLFPCRIWIFVLVSSVFLFALSQWYSCVSQILEFLILCKLLFISELLNLTAHLKFYFVRQKMVRA